MRAYDLIWLIPVLPLASFIVMVGVTVDQKRTSAWLGIMAALLADVLSIWLLFTELGHAQPHHYQVTMYSLATVGDLNLSIGALADPLAAVMAVVVCTVSAAIQIYSLEYMRGEEGFVRFFAFISLFTFSMLGVVVSTNFFQTYVFWELVGVCSYLLIGHYYKRPAAAAAAKKAFIVTRFADFPFLVGIGYIFFRFHNLDFYQLAPLWAAGKVSSVGLFIIAVLVFSGAAGKSAQFPFHVWLPDAMEGPTPISALIHAATMVAAGVYLVARTYNLFEASAAALAVVATLGAATSLMSAIWACAQDDIKRIIAYSTLSHLGLMMFGLGVGAYSAAVFHLFTHAWFKALLFLCAGSVIHVLHTQNIWEMGGLWRRMRITAWTMLIASLAAAGIPPLAGFWSKDAIMARVFSSGNGIWVMVALLIAFFSALYTFRLVFVVFAGEVAKRRAFDPRRIHESSRAMTIPMTILAILAAVAGFWSVVGGKYLFTKFVFVGAKPELESIDYVAVSASTAAALLGLLVAALFYSPGFRRAVRFAPTAQDFNRRFALAYAWSHSKGYFDEIYEAMLVRGLLLNTARAVQWADHHLVDNFVDGLAEGYELAASRVRRLQTGQVQTYTFGLLAGVVLVVVLMLIFASQGNLSPALGVHP